MRVFTVIPYFQQRPGILQSCVKAALDQTLGEEHGIVVVDDGSPVPAESELSGLMSRFPGRIQIIAQPNAGVGAARNKALGSLPPSADVVAFLDSDDIWTSDHLPRAVSAIDRGFDFYFSDFYQRDQQVSAFRRAGRMKLEAHRRLPDAEELYEYVGDMRDQIVTGNVIGTSVVAYSFRRFPDVRFRTEVRNAGEDYLFWLDIATRNPRIAFSTRCECRYGSGVNLYSADSWGTDQYLQVVIDDAKYRRILLKEYSLSATQRVAVQSRLKELRVSFVMGLLDHLKRRRGRADLGLLAAYWRCDRAIALAFVPIALRLLARKVMRRAKATS